MTAFALHAEVGTTAAQYGRRSVQPVVGAGRGLILLVADVDFEFFLEAAALPVGIGIAQVVAERSAAQINVANEHSAEMADVADVVTGRADGAEEFDGAEYDHQHPHRNGHGERKDVDLPVRHHEGDGQQYAVNRAGSADGGSNERLQPSSSARVKNNFLDHDVDYARADSA